MILAAGVGQMLAGCGENTPDDLRFGLPSVPFVVQGVTAPSATTKNSNGQWRQAPPGGVPAVVCAGPQAITTDCCALPPQYQAIDCGVYPVSCDALDNFCALTFDVELAADVNLLGVAEVAAVDGRSFADVSLLAMSSTLTFNKVSPNFPVRSARLYVGPEGLGSSSSPEARLVAEVPVAQGPTPIVPSVAGQQAFSTFARDYRVPFSWLLSLHVVVLTGTYPEVDATFTLAGEAEAHY